MEYSVTAFIDWGQERFELHSSRAGGPTVEARFEHSAAGISEALELLLQQAEGVAEQIRVGIERPDGLLVDALLQNGMAVYSINPKQVENLRKFLRAADVKSDFIDAQTGLIALGKLPEAFRRLDEPVGLWQAVTSWESMRVKWGKQRTALIQQAQELFNQYFPEFLKIASLTKVYVRELWRYVRTPARVETLDPARVEQILRRTNKSASDVIDTLSGPALPLCPELRDALVEQIERCLDLIDEYHRLERKSLREIRSLIGQHEAQVRSQDAASNEEPSDREIWQSLPGLGQIGYGSIFARAPMLLANHNIEGLRPFSGVAPCRRTTGKQEERNRGGNQRYRIAMRRSRDKHLAKAMHNWGEAARRHSPHYSKKYAEMRARGHTHGRACRQIVDQMLTVVTAMLRDRTLYDPQLHGATRRRRARPKPAANRG